VVCFAGEGSQVDWEAMLFAIKQGLWIGNCSFGYFLSRPDHWEFYIVQVLFLEKKKQIPVQDPCFCKGSGFDILVGYRSSFGHILLSCYFTFTN